MEIETLKELRDLLGDYFCDWYNIGDEKYEIEYIPAKELLVPGRIDLIIKYKYVEHIERKLDMQFIRKAYLSHIEAFTKGTFSEAGNSNKINGENYIEIFHELINSIKENGLDERISVIPLGKNNAIMDGAHRVAIAAYYNYNVPIIRFNHLVANNNLQFFRKRLLDQIFLDYTATEYTKMVKDARIFINWPRANEYKSEIRSIIKDNFTIVYEKSIELNYNGLRNLVIEAYRSHGWLGDIRKSYSGATPQVNGCYKKNGLLHIYLITGGDLEKETTVKEKIRKICKVGNYSIHSTDDANETIKLAKILFSNTTIAFLNNAHPDKYSRLCENLDKFKHLVSENKHDLDDYVIDSSTIMGLYGIRKTADIDYLSALEKPISTHNSIIENHIEFAHHYKKTVGDIIYNPTNYLYYNDIKFVTLEVLCVFKKMRAESKDVDDLKLIEPFISGNNQIIDRMHIIFSCFNRIRRNAFYSIRSSMVKITKVFGVYQILKKIYYKIIGEEKQYEAK